jgi:hypothetical protein
VHTTVLGVLSHPAGARVAGPCKPKALCAVGSTKVKRPGERGVLARFS